MRLQQWKNNGWLHPHQTTPAQIADACHGHFTIQRRDQLKARGQCRTSRGGSDEGRHHWLELDNNPLPEYLRLFSTPSVVYADIGKRLETSQVRPVSSREITHARKLVVT
jgi:hypothetical protein